MLVVPGPHAYVFQNPDIKPAEFGDQRIAARNKRREGGDPIAPGLGHSRVSGFRRIFDARDTHYGGGNDRSCHIGDSDEQPAARPLGECGLYKREER